MHLDVGNIGCNDRKVSSESASLVRDSKRSQLLEVPTNPEMRCLDVAQKRLLVRQREREDISEATRRSEQSRQPSVVDCGAYPRSREECGTRPEQTTAKNCEGRN